MHDPLPPLRRHYERLRHTLSDLRVAELQNAMTSNDPNSAHAAICHLIRDGFVSGPGGTVKLLSTGPYAIDFQEIIVALAGRFIQDAEAVRAPPRTGPILVDLSPASISCPLHPAPHWDCPDVRRLIFFDSHICTVAFFSS